MCVLYVSRMYTHTPNITTWYTKSIQTNRNRTKRNETTHEWTSKGCVCVVCVCTLTCTCTLDNLNDDHTLSCARTVEPLIRILIHLPFSFCRSPFCLLPCLLAYILSRSRRFFPSFLSFSQNLCWTHASKWEREGEVERVRSNRPCIRFHFVHFVFANLLYWLAVCVCHIEFTCMHLCGTMGTTKSANDTK